MCPDHPDRRATKFLVRMGREICKRYRSYEAASRFLTGIRFEHDEGRFDIREYRKDKPLSFQNLAYQWLAVKEGELKPKSHRNLFNTMKRAVEAWGERNIKEIAYADFEDFLNSQRLEKSGELVSSKTKLNMREVLHAFWTWLRKRGVLKLHEMPEFPEVPCDLGYRNIVNKTTQEKILEEIRRLTFDFDPKIWLGIN